ncbi:MAG: hypothetical protein V4467_04850 [Patescibacteria group bacterium]
MSNNQKAGLVITSLWLMIVAMFGWVLTSVVYRDTTRETLSAHKTMILTRATEAKAKPLTEPEKIAMFNLISGGQINQYNFSESDLKLLMQALNK